MKPEEVSGNSTQVAVAVAVLVVVLSTAAAGYFFFAVQGGKKAKARVEGGGGQAAAAAESQTFLNKERQSVKLKEKINLSPDTRLFRFALPPSTPVLGLPVGKHFKVWCPNPNVRKPKWNNQDDSESTKDEIERKYTPTTSDDDLGHFDLVIKVYFGGKLEKFPDGGKMSQYFEKLKIGDSIDICGPFGLIEYCGKGVFKNKGREVNVSKIAMMAGGTGITPMLQIIEAIHKDKQDATQVSLIFANQTEDDILLRSRLDEIAKADSRFKVWYTLDRPSANWAFSTGFINKDMVAKHLPSAAPDTVVLLCGPPPMIKFACKPALEELGYSKESIWEF